MTRITRSLAVLVASTLFACTPGESSSRTGSGSTPAPETAAPEKTAVVFLSGDESTEIGTEFSESSTVTTSNGLTLELPTGDQVELGESTTIRIAKLATRKSEPTLFRLDAGSIRSSVGKLEPSGTYRITTPVAVVGVRGTDFAIHHSGEDESDLDVFEGSVAVEERGAEQKIGPGDGATLTRREIRRRKIREEIHERWENMRERMIENLRRKFRGEDGEFDPELKNFLKKIPAERREQIREKVKERLDKAAARRDRVVERIEERRENGAAGREVPPRKKPVRAPARRTTR